MDYEKYYRVIALDLSKQQVLQKNKDLIQQINFIGRLEVEATIFLSLKKKKKQFQNFLKILRTYNINNGKSKNHQFIK